MDLSELPVEAEKLADHVRERSAAVADMLIAAEDLQAAGRILLRADALISALLVHHLVVPHE